jgi:predicted MPP superfamily phosphohydrolase
MVTIRYCERSTKEAIIQLIEFFCSLLPIPIALLPFIVLPVMGFLVYRTWGELETSPSLPRWAVIGVLILALADLIFIVGLPFFNRSYIYIGPVWFTTTLLRVTPFLLLAVTLKWLRVRGTKYYTGKLPRRSLLGLVLLNLILYPLLFYSMYIEPFDVRVSTVPVDTPAFFPDRPLRIVHLSDLHVERTTQREEDLLALINDLDPDMIVLTGDYIHIGHKNDPVAREHTRALLDGLHAPYGVFAVIGSSGVDTPQVVEAIFQGTDIILLEDQVHHLQFEGENLYVLGITSLARKRDAGILSQLVDELPEDVYKLLLYHTPEIVSNAADAGVDLYLAGHTHGGQIGLPLVPLAIKIVGGFDYVKGLHTIGPMTLYITRGVGMEGIGYPPVRFNSPPEIALIELGPIESTAE